MGEGDHRGMGLPSDGVSASASGLAARKGSACATHHCWRAQLNVTLNPRYPRRSFGKGSIWSDFFGNVELGGDGWGGRWEAPGKQ